MSDIGVRQGGQNHPDTRGTLVIMTETKRDMSQGFPGVGSLDQGHGQ